MYTPFYPSFIYIKLGFTGVYLFFLFLIQNIDCWYSSNVLSKSMENIKIIPMKFSVITAEKISVYCMGKFL